MLPEKGRAPAAPTLASTAKMGMPPAPQLDAAMVSAERADEARALSSADGPAPDEETDAVDDEDEDEDEDEDDEDDNEDDEDKALAPAPARPPPTELTTLLQPRPRVPARVADWALSRGTTSATHRRSPNHSHSDSAANAPSAAAPATADEGPSTTRRIIWWHANVRVVPSSSL